MNYECYYDYARIDAVSTNRLKVVSITCVLLLADFLDPTEVALDLGV